MKPLHIFGIVCGLVWATVPLFLSELNSSTGEIVSVYFAGAITGLFVSWVLGLLLPEEKRIKRICIGFASLPLGAFLFGVNLSVLHGLIELLTGISYRMIEYRFAPIEVGASYAMMSVFSFFVVGLAPLAIISTFLLNQVIKKSNQSAQATSILPPVG